MHGQTGLVRRYALPHLCHCASLLRSAGSRRCDLSGHGVGVQSHEEREAELQRSVAKAQVCTRASSHSEARACVGTLTPAAGVAEQVEQELATDEEWRRRDTQEAIEAQASGNAAFRGGACPPVDLEPRPPVGVAGEWNAGDTESSWWRAEVGHTRAPSPGRAQVFRWEAEALSCTHPAPCTPSPPPALSAPHAPLSPPPQGTWRRRCSTTRRRCAWWRRSGTKPWGWTSPTSSPTARRRSRN